MAFCPNCGAQVAGAYCPNCGTAVAGGAASSGTGPGAAGTAGAGYSGTTPPPIAQAPGLTENVAGALCYFGWFVTGIIFLVLAPYNRNKTIRFHAFQSIFASIAIIIARIILDIILGLMFVGGAFWTGFALRRLFDIVVLLGWLYMMYTAYNNKIVKLPVVGDLAQKQA